MRPIDGDSVGQHIVDVLNKDVQARVQGVGK